MHSGLGMAGAMGIVMTFLTFWYVVFVTVIITFREGFRLVNFILVFFLKFRCICAVQVCVSALQSSAYIESARRSAYPAKAKHPR